RNAVVQPFHQPIAVIETELRAKADAADRQSVIRCVGAAGQCGPQGLPRGHRAPVLSILTEQFAEAAQHRAPAISRARSAGSATPLPNNGRGAQPNGASRPRSWTVYQSYPQALTRSTMSRAA